MKLDKVFAAIGTKNMNAFAAMLYSLPRYSGGSERIRRPLASGLGWGPREARFVRQPVPPPQPSPGVPGAGEKRFNRAGCACIATAFLMLAAVPAAGAVTFGQLDDFQTGGTLGWQQGAQATQPPTIVSSGGPNGAGDAYLQNVSVGGGGGSSKQTMFNMSQWLGDFVTADVTRIDAGMANFGSTPLAMRVSIQGGQQGTIFASTSAVALPADGGIWHAVQFDLTSSALSLVAGSESLSTVLSNVTDFRLLSAANGPNSHGDSIVSTLGVDDIRALTIPGDANHDGTVNFSDLVTLARHYGSSSATWETGDFNFDGKVGFDDLVLLARDYGQSVSAAQLATFSPAFATDVQAAFAQVPEPRALAALGVLGLFLQRRRVRGAC